MFGGPISRRDAERAPILQTTDGRPRPARRVGTAAGLQRESAPCTRCASPSCPPGPPRCVSANWPARHAAPATLHPPRCTSTLHPPRHQPRCTLHAPHPPRHQPQPPRPPDLDGRKEAARVYPCGHRHIPRLHALLRDIAPPRAALHSDREGTRSHIAPALQPIIPARVGSPTMIQPPTCM